MNENAIDHNASPKQTLSEPTPPPLPSIQVGTTFSVTPIDTRAPREPSSTDHFAARALGVLCGVALGLFTGIVVFVIVGFPVALLHHYVIPWEPFKVVGFGFATLLGIAGVYGVCGQAYRGVVNRLLYGTWDGEPDIIARLDSNDATNDHTLANCDDASEGRPETREECCTRILDAHQKHLHDPLIYRKPQILEAKLTNAINTYAPSVDPQSVLLLLDASGLGTGMSGAMLTTTTLYSHNSCEPAQSFNLQDIHEISCRSGWFAKLRVNDQVNIDMGQIGAPAIRGFVRMMADLLEAARHYDLPASNESPDTQAQNLTVNGSATTPGIKDTSLEPTLELLRQLKQLHSEGVLSEEEFSEKKEQLLATLGN